MDEIIKAVEIFSGLTKNDDIIEFSNMDYRYNTPAIHLKADALPDYLCTACRERDCEAYKYEASFEDSGVTVFKLTNKIPSHLKPNNKQNNEKTR